MTRAAEKLFITQSALSSRIATLETELGSLLLDRRDKQFRVTTAGARFHRHAERLLDLQREIKAEFGQGAERPMLLRLGAIESVLHSWSIEWVQALRQAHPALELSLAVETTPVLLDQMNRGTADVVLTALPAAGSGVVSLPLAPMPMVLVGRKSRPGRKRYTLQQLTALPIHLSWRNDPAATAAQQAVDSVLAFNGHAPIAAARGRGAGKPA